MNTSVHTKSTKSDSQRKTFFNKSKNSPIPAIASEVGSCESFSLPHFGHCSGGATTKTSLRGEKIFDHPHIWHL
jgi:hypothetical protein